MLMKVFTYHPNVRLHKCHLVFAHDLFILHGADIQSFQYVDRLLDDFQENSGLIANLLKSSVMFAGVSTENKAALHKIWLFQSVLFQLSTWVSLLPQSNSKQMTANY